MVDLDHPLYRRLGSLALPPSQTFAPHILQPNFENGPWIAGGAPKAWLQDKEITADIDVYCKTNEQHEYLIDVLKSRGFTEHFNTDNAVTMKWTSPETITDIKQTHYDVQLIKKEFFDHPYEILDTYDFAQCQLVTDGYTVYGNPDWEKRELQIVSYKQDTILKRFIKYYSYGYDVPPGTLSEWAKDPELNYEFENTDDY